MIYQKQILQEYEKIKGQYPSARLASEAIAKHHKLDSDEVYLIVIHLRTEATRHHLELHQHQRYA